MDSSSSDNTGVLVFFIIMFLVLFVLPAWLIVRHHKKSKAKIELLKSSQPTQSPEDISKKKRESYITIGSIVGIVIGTLIGSRLFDSILLGFVLSVALGAIVAFIASRLGKDKSET